MKKFIGILSLVLFLTVGQSYATERENDSENSRLTQITGVVIDHSTNESLAGVEVSIEELGVKTYTDFEGKFEFVSLKPGSYEIKASYISYEEKMKSVEVDPSASNDLAIKIQAVN